MRIKRRSDFRTVKNIALRLVTFIAVISFVGQVANAYPLCFSEIWAYQPSEDMDPIIVSISVTDDTIDNGYSNLVEAGGYLYGPSPWIFSTGVGWGYTDTFNVATALENYWEVDSYHYIWNYYIAMSSAGGWISRLNAAAAYRRLNYVNGYWQYGPTCIGPCTKSAIFSSYNYPYLQCLGSHWYVFGWDFCSMACSRRENEGYCQ